MQQQGLSCSKFLGTLVHTQKSGEKILHSLFRMDLETIPVFSSLREE